jgi:hypothetical protein
MRLEDFSNMVDNPSDDENMLVELSSIQFAPTRYGVTTANEIIDNMLIAGLCTMNVLAGNTLYAVIGGYNSPLGRSGVIFEKTDVDYEADDTHFVYRCLLTLRTNLQLNRNNGTGQAANAAGTRGAAIRAIINQARTAGTPLNTGTVGLEVTVYGCFDGSTYAPEPLPEAQFNANWYNMSLANLRRAHPNPFGVRKRGEVFSLFTQNGMIGAIQIQKLQSGNAGMRPLTEHDMSEARAFSVSHKPYTGWIPTLESPEITHDGATRFHAHKTGNTDRSFRGNTLIDKVVDRRCHFNGDVSFLIQGKRYSLEQGEYFFTPDSEIVTTFSVRDYDEWLTQLSGLITMTRVQSRVGFMSNFSSSDELVRSTNIKPKTIQSGSPDDDSPVFTGKANTSRLK